MSNTPVGAILQALLTATGRIPRQHGDSWASRCPAHEDNNPSLSISAGNDGRALLHCHAGCPTEAVLAALDVRAADLFPEETRRDRDPNHGPGGTTITSTYDYVDEHGRTVFQVVRLHPKDFRQRQPDGDGWNWSLRSLTPEQRSLPYRLPDLLAAKAQDRVIYVPEGEKDVETLRAAGYPATCNAGGAGKWTTGHAHWLAGADVGVIADRDEAGHAHAIAVVRSLLDAGSRSIDLLETPDPAHKDVTDHLSAGRRIRELRTVDTPRPFPQPTA